MEYDFEDMRKLRKQIGLTQAELAKLARVSQSLIAKMESGLIDPGYSKVKGIMQVLEDYNHRQERKASDIMQRKVITLNAHDPIRKAIELMRKHGISQVPIMERERVVGIVTENDLLDVLSNGKNVRTVEEAMEDAPPVVSEGTPIKLIYNLLKYYPLITVMERGKLKGIITKSDIINSIR